MRPATDRPLGDGWMDARWRCNRMPSCHATVVNVSQVDGWMSVKLQNGSDAFIMRMDRIQAESSGAPVYAGLRSPPLRAGHMSPCCREAAAFHIRCAVKTRAYEAHLAAASNRRALAIHFTAPNSAWGVGHVMPLALLAHKWCVDLRRKCYLKMFDLELESMFTYPNGDSWAWTEERTIALQESLGPAVNLSIACRCPSAGRLARLYLNRVHDTIASTKHELAPLIMVNVTMPSIGWFNSQDYLQGLDRCLSHFVTQPRPEVFPLPPAGRDGAPAGRAGAERTQCVTRGERTHAFHFRTGVADVSDAQLATSASKSSLDETRYWFEAAGCNRSFWQALGDRGLILSDSYKWAHFLSNEFGSAHLMPSAAKQATRSWQSPWESKVAAVNDMLAASRATNLYVTANSHFAGAILARSVCVTHVHAISEACPRFQELFLRRRAADNVQLIEALAQVMNPSNPSNVKRAARDRLMPMMSYRLQPWHPCFKRSVTECWERHLMAVG